MTQSAIDPWEAAYLRFETPAEEIGKFTSRLKALGALAWPKEARIVELFCGRANGLVALERLGFSRLEGVDISATLLRQYAGPARLHTADCRQLPFEDASRDILIVQGGLHHLTELPADLEATLAEARRVLTPGGLFVAVEPWNTPFLRFVHAVTAIPGIGHLSAKMDALRTMIDHERTTYENWLRQPALVLAALERNFRTEISQQKWGKLFYRGAK